MTGSCSWSNHDSICREKSYRSTYQQEARYSEPQRFLVWWAWWPLDLEEQQPFDQKQFEFESTPTFVTIIHSAPYCCRWWARGSLRQTFVRKSCFIHWYFCSYEISAIVCICWNKHEWDRQYTFHCRGRGLPQGQALMCCFHPTIPLRLGRWMFVYRYRHPWILRKCRLTFQSHPPPASRAHFRLRCRDFKERKTCNEWGYFLKTHESSICSSCRWLNQFRTTITGGLIIICH